MSKIIDSILNLIKWPIAIVSFWSIFAFYQSIEYFNFATLKFVALIGGIIFFFSAKATMDKEVKTSMEIIAHELTHAFFALITFHKVKHIRVSPDNSGGSMGFEGSGNWLIILAPYFFPLFCFGFMLIAGFVTNIGNISWVINVIFGYFIGYHIDSVASQIHPKQTDLPKAGYFFCLAFLPGANFWAIGTMFAFNSNGWSSAFRYQTLIWRQNINNLNWLLDFIV